MKIVRLGDATQERKVEKNYKIRPEKKNNEFNLLQALISMEAQNKIHTT